MTHTAAIAQAASIIQDHPVSIQLGFLQSLSEVAAQNNSTMVVPVPVDLISSFLGKKA